MAERHDLVLVGMGSGGLVAAEFATTIGVKPVVVERGRDVQQRIAATDDSPERYESMGVEFVYGAARLSGPNSVAADGRVLESKHILLCTGSRPAVPPIDGPTEAGFLTSETVWEVDDPPRSVVIVGGGPIAVEMAQGMNRLGIAVALLEREGRLLARDEPELVDLVTDRLRREGVDVRLNVAIDRVSGEDGLKVVHAGRDSWRAEAILVAAGRTANVDGLGL